MSDVTPALLMMGDGAVDEEVRGPVIADWSVPFVLHTTNIVPVLELMRWLPPCDILVICSNGRAV